MDLKSQLINLLVSVEESPAQAAASLQQLEGLQREAGFLRAISGILTEPAVSPQIIRLTAIFATDFIKKHWKDYRSSSVTDQDVHDFIYVVFNSITHCRPIDLVQLCQLLQEVLVKETCPEWVLQAVSDLFNTDSLRGAFILYFINSSIRDPLSFCRQIAPRLLAQIGTSVALASPMTTCVASLALTQLITRVDVQLHGTSDANGGEYLNMLVTESLKVAFAASADALRMTPRFGDIAAARAASALNFAASFILDTIGFTSRFTVYAQCGEQLVQTVISIMRASSALLVAGMDEVLADPSLVALPDEHVGADTSMFRAISGLTQVLSTSKEVRKALKPHLLRTAQNELVPLLITFLQITQASEAEWLSHPELFIAGQDGNDFTYSARTMSSQCIEILVTYYPKSFPDIILSTVASSFIEATNSRTTDPHWWRRVEAALLAAQITYQSLYDEENPSSLSANVRNFFSTMSTNLLIPLTVEGSRSKETMTGDPNAQIGTLLLCRIIVVASMCVSLVGYGPDFFGLAVRALAPENAAILRIAGAKALCAFTRVVGTSDVDSHLEAIVYGLRDMLNAEMAEVATLAIGTLALLASHASPGMRVSMAELAGQTIVKAYQTQVEDPFMIESAGALIMVLGRGCPEAAAFCRETVFPAIHDLIIGSSVGAVVVHYHGASLLYRLCSAGGIEDLSKNTETVGPSMALPLSQKHMQLLAEVAQFLLPIDDTQTLSVMCQAVAMALLSGQANAEALLPCAEALICTMLTTTSKERNPGIYASSVINLASRYLQIQLNQRVLRTVITYAAASIADDNCGLMTTEAIAACLGITLARHGAMSVLTAAMQGEPVGLACSQGNDSPVSHQLNDQSFPISHRMISGAEAFTLAYSYFFWFCSSSYAIASAVQGIPALLACPEAHNLPAVSLSPFCQNEVNVVKRSRGIYDKLHTATLLALKSFNDGSVIQPGQKIGALFPVTTTMNFSVQAIISSFDFDLQACVSANRPKNQQENNDSEDEYDGSFGFLDGSDGLGLMDFDMEDLEFGGAVTEPDPWNTIFNNVSYARNGEIAQLARRALQSFSSLFQQNLSSLPVALTHSTLLQ